MWGAIQIVLALLLVGSYAAVWWSCRRRPIDLEPSIQYTPCAPPDRWRCDPDVIQMYVGKGSSDRYRVAFGAHEVTGDELYILVCDDEHACDLVDRAADWAADPELSFDEDDFMRVQRQMGSAKI